MSVATEVCSDFVGRSGCMEVGMYEVSESVS